MEENSEGRVGRTVTPQEIAYLARYGFAFLIFLMGLLLLKSSLVDFRGRMQANLRPVKGFFLMALGSETDKQVKSYPLFHTTTIGNAKSNDINIKQKGIAYRHAVIYLFDSHWYIRPSNMSSPVMLNGFLIKEPIPLENQDEIVIGERKFVFISERLATFSEGLSYIEDADDMAEPPHQLKTRFAWLLTNLYMIAGTLLTYFLIRGPLLSKRKEVLLVFGGFFLMMNLYYLLIPLILKYVDRVIVLAATQLAFIGLLIQTRFLYISWLEAELTPEMMSRISAQFFGNAFALALGMIVLPIMIFLCAKTNFMEYLTIICGIAVPAMLVALLIFGKGSQSHGASLWIYIGNQSIQLTEFVKIAYLIVLAAFFKNRPPTKVQIAFAAWAAVVFFLIMMLPDLGTAMVLLPTTLVVFFVMTSEYIKTLGILIGGTAMGALAYSLFPYVQRRIAGWASLWSEVNDQNRQIVYGLQAVARGGAVGRGLGNGSPESIAQYMDDMVFDAVCEELGLITGVIILVLFIVIWLRSTRITMQVRDGFTSSLILGLGTAFFFEAAVVIAGNTGIIPLTGATLPFIAAGGSSLLAKFIMLGILLGMGARREGGIIKNETLPA